LVPIMPVVPLPRYQYLTLSSLRSTSVFGSSTGCYQLGFIDYLNLRQ
jgi:hypothetical protein